MTPESQQLAAVITRRSYLRAGDRHPEPLSVRRRALVTLGVLLALWALTVLGLLELVRYAKAAGWLS